MQIHNENFSEKVGKSLKEIVITKIKTVKETKNDKFLAFAKGNGLDLHISITAIIGERLITVNVNKVSHIDKDFKIEQGGKYDILVSMRFSPLKTIIPL